MKLSECLLYRDISELKEMASLYECLCNRNSKLELVQSIHYQMLNRKQYGNLFNEIEEGLLLFITYLAFQSKVLFSIHELIAKGNDICHWHNLKAAPKEWITQLLKLGWLFPHPSKFQIQLTIPLDFQRFLRELVMNFWLKKHEAFAQKPVTVGAVLDHELTILADLHIFLKEISANPLPLTQEGVIYKKNQQQLLDKFNVQEVLLREKAWRFGYGRRFPVYPNRFALIYDFCFNQGWILEEQLQLSLTDVGEQVLKHEYVQEYRQTIYQDLIKYWCKLYKQPIPVLPFLYNFLSETNEQWLLTGQVATLFQPWIQNYYYDNAQVILSERILQMLLYLGKVQLSVDGHYIKFKK